jgi:hypothetical protein
MNSFLSRGLHWGVLGFKQPDAYKGEKGRGIISSAFLL